MPWMPTCSVIQPFSARPTSPEYARAPAPGGFISAGNFPSAFGTARIP